jgi:Dyp-type peroxidase family
VAFTATGLTALGLASDALAGFSFEFRDGMVSEHRTRILGDVEDSSPEKWQWGGPTQRPVDVLVMLYAVDREALEEGRSILDLDHSGVSIIKELDTSRLTDREHFGFHDGISQPAIEGSGRNGSPENTIKAGEFLLGYENEYGRYADRPSVERSSDAAGVLPEVPGASGRSELGRNGTYLVFRQLAQDVPGFWGCMDERSADIGGALDREALAAKMVGRWPSGAPLVAAPDRDDQTMADANDFGYHHEDPYGLRCPKGSHIRRTHPRDSLDPDPGTDASVAVGKRHRIARRGRQYGELIRPEEAVGSASGDEERGLHFICLNANIARQFEFIQHTWMNNPKFDGLYEDADPVVTSRGGNVGTFTIPATPVRVRVTGLPSFVTVRGGAYFFLPGISAIRYIGELGS